MRRVIFAALMIALPLCSCKTAANDSNQAALDMRTALLASGGRELSCDLRADYGDKVYEFTLDCDFSRVGDSTVEVVSPELISGVSATVSESGSALSFDGVSLDTGKLPNTQLTPLGAVPAMAEAWCTGYIANTCMTEFDGESCLFVSCLCGYGSDELEYRTWFSRESFEPLYGEIVSGGDVVIYVDFL